MVLYSNNYFNFFKYKGIIKICEVLKFIFKYRILKLIWNIFLEVKVWFFL